MNVTRARAALANACDELKGGARLARDMSVAALRRRLNPQMEDERQVQFYCPEHKMSFVARVGGGVTVFCGNDACEHVIALNFPGEAFWEYCCDCERFYSFEQARALINEGEGDNDTCLACGRASVRRFLCSSCNVISLKSNNKESRPFKVTRVGTIYPHCPGCLNGAAAVVEHECRRLDFGFTTAHPKCPFCTEEIQTALSGDTGLDVAGAPRVIAGESAVVTLVAATAPTRTADGNGHGPAAETEAAGEEADTQAPAAELNARIPEGVFQKLGRRYTWLVVRLHTRWMRYGAASLAIATFLGLLLQSPIKDWLRAKFTNHRPVVKMVIPDKDKVSVDGNVKLIATPQDDDGDEIHYEWQPSKGKIDGDSDKPMVILNLTGSGTEPGDELTVRLFIRDKDVTSEPFDTKIQVLSNHKPRLPPLQQSATQVYLGDTVTLTAAPRDSDHGDEDVLTYRWSPSGGFLEGDTTHSPKVVLNTSGVNILASYAQVVVSLTVEDKYDASEEQKATITVVPKRQEKAPAPMPTPQQGEAVNNSQVSIHCPDCSAVEPGGLIRLQALPDDINVSEFTFEWRFDDQRLRFVAEGAERFVGKGREVTLDTSGLKGLNSRRDFTIWLAVTNLQTRKSRVIPQTVTVFPADAKSQGPIPSTHPEQPPPAPPNPSPEVKPSGR